MLTAGRPRKGAPAFSSRNPRFLGVNGTSNVIVWSAKTSTRRDATANRLASTKLTSSRPGGKSWGRPDGKEMPKRGQPCADPDAYCPPIKRTCVATSSPFGFTQRTITRTGLLSPEAGTTTSVGERKAPARTTSALARNQPMSGWHTEILHRFPGGIFLRTAVITWIGSRASCSANSVRARRTAGGTMGSATSTAQSTYTGCLPSERRTAPAKRSPAT